MTNFSSQRRALVVQNDFSPFGNKLIQSGYVNRDQMQQALVESRKTGKPLTQIIEALTGQALPPDLIRQYKKQQLFELKILYGVESMDPELDERPIDEVGELIDTLIPID
ncbi:MAG: type II/IV secretion system protein, partial [Synechococcales cyanobacterium CRU_2_2]|nr:type II/IV secretion system protein [Synechococcales cyanobacterium CRU_2_2]